MNRGGVYAASTSNRARAVKRHKCRAPNERLMESSIGPGLWRRFSICRIAELHSADRQNALGPSGWTALPAGSKPALRQIKNLRYEHVQSALDAALAQDRPGPPAFSKELWVATLPLGFGV
jgi:hypothetical protein